ncbi:urease accessory protein UreD [Xanthobacter autotrophicus]|nr:urease accessory protein UreD [Xanthobacter autotrophicus]MDI4666847.1 urease accessory protein UreD [Xanthobacter autotrophicus]
MSAATARERALRQRSEGRVRIAVAAFAGVTRLSDLAEGGALRARLPRGGPGLEAVIVNTAGGVASGDVFSIAAQAGPGTHLTVATPAAEKVYRSDGACADIRVRLAAEAGARLEWLPQETILFDRARLKRRYEIDLSGSSSFLSFEALMLGRLAHGDAMGEAHLEDHWRVRRDGALIFADALRLAGPVGALLARPAVAGGNRALATLLYVAPDAERRLEEARVLLEGARSEVGASTWNGLLCVRLLAPDIETLRRDATSFLMAFRKAPLPRVWAT